ncbi:hypothetical protein GHT06_017055 [Daphnia sinensis]|uniref:Uncharacterized protein n=1 Tax=Daphnia sinensis TaxID=1820382 RepID=A0AAD5KPC0_9CRUS|nr:hypothetical protein GHT06_017055 [Daphnia sinensis]
MKVMSGDTLSFVCLNTTRLVRIKRAQLRRDGLLPAWVEPPRPPPAIERIPDDQLPTGARAPGLQPFLEIARRILTVEQLAEATRPLYYGDIRYAPPGVPVGYPQPVPVPAPITVPVPAPQPVPVPAPRPEPQDRLSNRAGSCRSKRVVRRGGRRTPTLLGKLVRVVGRRRYLHGRGSERIRLGSGKNSLHQSRRGKANARHFHRATESGLD